MVIWTVLLPQSGQQGDMASSSVGRSLLFALKLFPNSHFKGEDFAHRPVSLRVKKFQSRRVSVLNTLRICSL